MEYVLKKNILAITNNSKTIYLEFLKDQIIRVYEKKVKQDLYEYFERVDKTSFEIVSEDNFVKVYYYDKVVLINENLNVTILKDDKEYVSFEFANELDNHITSFAISNDARIMGLGDKVSSLNKRGYVYESWATDHPWHHDELYETLYKAMNSLIVYSNNEYFGLFFPSTFRYYFDLAKYDLDVVKVKSKYATNDVYVFLCNSPKEIISSLIFLTTRRSLSVPT